MLYLLAPENTVKGRRFVVVPSSVKNLPVSTQVYPDYVTRKLGRRHGAKIIDAEP